MHGHPPGSSHLSPFICASSPLLFHLRGGVPHAAARGAGGRCAVSCVAVKFGFVTSDHSQSDVQYLFPVASGMHFFETVFCILFLHLCTPVTSHHQWQVPYLYCSPGVITRVHPIACPTNQDPRGSSQQRRTLSASNPGTR